MATQSGADLAAVHGNTLSRARAALAGNLLDLPPEGVVQRLPVILLTLAMAASPALPFICKAWCAPQQATMTGGCHHSESRDMTQLARDTACTTALDANGPALKEDSRRVMAPLSPLSAAAVRTLPASLPGTPASSQRLHSGRLAAHPLASPLVLRV